MPSQRPSRSRAISTDLPPDTREEETQLEAVLASLQAKAPGHYLIGFACLEIRDVVLQSLQMCRQFAEHRHRTERGEP